VAVRVVVGRMQPQRGEPIRRRDERERQHPDLRRGERAELRGPQKREDPEGRPVVREEQGHAALEFAQRSERGRDAWAGSNVGTLAFELAIELLERSAAGVGFEKLFEIAVGFEPGECPTRRGDDFQDRGDQRMGGIRGGHRVDENGRVERSVAGFVGPTAAFLGGGVILLDGIAISDSVGIRLRIEWSTLSR